jgi:hypothetical protein
MLEQQRVQPHILSTIAANVVRETRDHLPGTWDFEKAFRRHIELIELRARAEENEFMASTAAATEARTLHLFTRGVELRNAISMIEEELNPKKR